MANGTLSEAAALELRVRIGQIIGTFPDGPPADQLVPAPATVTASPDPGSTTVPGSSP